MRGPCYLNCHKIYQFTYKCIMWKFHTQKYKKYENIKVWVHENKKKIWWFEKYDRLKIMIFQKYKYAIWIWMMSKINILPLIY